VGTASTSSDVGVDPVDDVVTDRPGTVVVTVFVDPPQPAVAMLKAIVATVTAPRLRIGRCYMRLDQSAGRVAALPAADDRRSHLAMWLGQQRTRHDSPKARACPRAIATIRSGASMSG
jgi:hypothetical protein